MPIVKIRKTFIPPTLTASALSASLFFVASLHAGYAAPTESRPADEKLWLACEQNADCTSVKLGCYYWQAVNKKNTLDMAQKYDYGCLASTPEGPQPGTVCADHICTNFYTIKYWKSLGTHSTEGQIVKYRILQEQISTCIQQADIPAAEKPILTANKINGSSNAPMYDQLIENMDKLTRDGVFADDEPMQKALDKTVDCRGVIEKAQPHKN